MMKVDLTNSPNIAIARYSSQKAADANLAREGKANGGIEQGVPNKGERDGLVISREAVECRISVAKGHWKR